MKIIYKNPGFGHSIESILLFQEDDMEPYWYLFQPEKGWKKKPYGEWNG